MRILANVFTYLVLVLVFGLTGYGAWTLGKRFSGVEAPEARPLAAPSDQDSATRTLTAVKPTEDELKGLLITTVHSLMECEQRYASLWSQSQRLTQPGLSEQWHREEE